MLESKSDERFLSVITATYCYKTATITITIINLIKRSYFEALWLNFFCIDKTKLIYRADELFRINYSIVFFYSLKFKIILKLHY